MANVNEACAAPQGVTWFALRRSGTLQRTGWLERASAANVRALARASEAEVVEACILQQRHAVATELDRIALFGVGRGILGVEIRSGDEVIRITPLEMIAENVGFRRVMNDYAEAEQVSVGELQAQERLFSFSAHQLLVAGGITNAATELYRGSTLVDVRSGEEWSHARALADGITSWMVRNLTHDGALPYAYWPSRETEPSADNAIRRFLAAWALARAGNVRCDANLQRAAVRNLRHNLKRYFRATDDGLGIIDEGKWAKLGAAGLAGLAILESSSRGEFDEELRLLAKATASLQDDEAGLRTFFFPPERDGENWNFYSGEGLLFCAEARRQRVAGAPSLEQCAQIFERCRKRHRARRNPAFVPWHTQACASLYEQTGRRELAEFALEMNDWLLPMQQWDGMPPDLRGRFYDPRRREFGPPHASSTGVYTESLAAAATIAGKLGDSRRSATYREGLRRGLRALRQLQFRDARDAFYVTNRDRVLGALRTETYDNRMRIDNAGHALLAATSMERLFESAEEGRSKSEVGASDGTVASRSRERSERATP